MPKSSAKELLFEHVIVLMLENRSFDHLFGHLGKGEGLKKDAVNYLIPGDKNSAGFRTGRSTCRSTSTCSIRRSRRERVRRRRAA